jgi:hypothetical protein
MELPDIHMLEEKLLPTMSIEDDKDNIVTEIDPETKALVDKVNSASPENFDEAEVKELHNHIENRRLLAEKLEKDKKFRDEYVTRQKLLADAKTIKNTEDIEKEFDKLTKSKIMEDFQQSDMPEFPEIPEIPEIQTQSGARNIINISGSNHITLHFH